MHLSIGKNDGTLIASYDYTYDENDNRTSVKDHTGKVITYTYDEQNQLLSETDPVTGNTIHYTYDPRGNRTSKVVKDADGNVISSVSYTYNAMNQLTSVSGQPYTYDDNGNLIDDGDKLYVWDAAGRLVQVKKKSDGSIIAEYEYDEDGRRIRSTVNGVVTNYVYDGDSNNVLYETNASNQIVRYYTYSSTGQLLSMTKVGVDTYYYHTNAHGDVVAVTDASNNIVASYTYGAWGNILEQSGSFADENPYRYAGYRYDKETGLYYLMARYYNPKNGNFLSLDPDPGDEDDPQTQNGYNYANNNPVIGLDPDGHWVWFAVSAAIAAYDAYKAYKRGEGWKGVAKAAALSLIGGGRFKALKYAGKFVRVMGKRFVKKTVAKYTGIRIVKIGRIKPANAGKKHGKGYFGIKWWNVRTGGRRSLEWHTPHNGHGFHIQLNYWSQTMRRYKGKWAVYRKRRLTIIPWRDWIK